MKHFVKSAKVLSGTAGAVMTIFLLMLSNASAQSGSPGAVYTMTNAVPNAVIVYDRSSNGLLTQAGEFATGGNGTGMGLGNQGAVVLSRNNRWLFVVNAGSNSVSVFDVLPDGLRLTDVASSGGATPISVTV